MKKVFNKVIAVAATVPLALTQGFAVLSNAADATTISVEYWKLNHRSWSPIGQSS